MSKKQLARRLYTLSVLALIEANKGNPFINRAEAMASINTARALMKAAGI